MKVTRFGWVGKTTKLRLIKDARGPYANFDVPECMSKRDKSLWFPKDWPPRKIRITVENVEET